MKKRGNFLLSKKRNKGRQLLFDKIKEIRSSEGESFYYFNVYEDRQKYRAKIINDGQFLDHDDQLIYFNRKVRIARWYKDSYFLVGNLRLSYTKVLNHVIGRIIELYPIKDGEDKNEIQT